MIYKIKMTYPAESFCSVEANSEEELRAALREDRYEIYEETCGDTEHYYLLEVNGEDASDDMGYFPEVFPYGNSMQES